MRIVHMRIAPWFFYFSESPQRFWNRPIEMGTVMIMDRSPKAAGYVVTPPQEESELRVRTGNPGAA